MKKQLDLILPSTTTSPHLFVTHTAQLRPPTLSTDHATLSLLATSLCHAPPSTLAFKINNNMLELLDVHPGESPDSTANDGHLILSRTLKTGASASGRAIKHTFQITGRIKHDPASEIFDFKPDESTDPAFEIYLEPEPHGCTKLTMFSTVPCTTRYVHADQSTLPVCLPIKTRFPHSSHAF